MNGRPIGKKKKNSNELDLYIKNIRDKIFQNDMWLKT